MKKYIPIFIGIIIGWFITISSCVNPLVADDKNTNVNGKYAVAATGVDGYDYMGDVYCVIIDTETGDVVNKFVIREYKFENYTE